MSLMLIADDNPQLLNILSSAARREGFDTVTALDGPGRPKSSCWM